MRLLVTTRAELAGGVGDAANRRRCRPPAACGRTLAGVGEWGPGEDVHSLNPAVFSAR